MPLHCLIFMFTRGSNHSTYFRSFALQAQVTIMEESDAAGRKAYSLSFKNYLKLFEIPMEVQFIRHNRDTLFAITVQQLNAVQYITVPA